MRRCLVLWIVRAEFCTVLLAAMTPVTGTWLPSLLSPTTLILDVKPCVAWYSDLSHERRFRCVLRSGGPCKQSTQEILDLVNACNAEMDRSRPHAAVA